MAVEVFVLPGFLLPGIVGVLLIVGSVFWAMVGVWPNSDIVWSPELFREPAVEFMQAIALAFVSCFVVSRILPKTPLWNWMVLSETVGGPEVAEGKKRRLPGAREWSRVRWA